MGTPVLDTQEVARRPAVRRSATAAADLDLVIPAFNEEHRIGPTLLGLTDHLRSAGVNARILVVDNGSVDGTADLVHTLRMTTPTRVISCQTRGKGAAVRAGVAAATAPFVGYCDADLSTPPESVIEGLEALTDGRQIVIGSRRVNGARYAVQQSLVRRLGSRAFHTYAASVIGPIADSQCGFKLFRTDVAQQIFADVRLTGFAFDVEVLGRARLMGVPVHELPIEWSDAEGSTFRPVRDGLAAFREVSAVRRALGGR